MRVVKAMVHVATVCPRCGGEMIGMGLADVTPDGRIGAPVADALPDECNACRKELHDAEVAEYDRAREQRRWADKRVGPKVGRKR